MTCTKVRLSTLVTRDCKVQAFIDDAWLVIHKRFAISVSESSHTSDVRVAPLS